MLLKLSWRNIWRNRRRSLVVISSVIVGVMAALMMDAFQNGAINQMLFNQVNLNASDVQIHKSGFRENKVIQNYIENSEKIDDAIAQTSGINAVSKRVVTFGLVSSADNSAGIYLYGINPKDESAVSIIDESVSEGSFFTGGKREIVLGKKLAEKLKVELGDKVVAMANTPDGSIGSEVFRLVGIFNSARAEMDKSFIFVPIEIAQEMLDIPGKYHEVAIKTDSHEIAEKVNGNLAAILDGDFEALSYRKILPMLVMQLDMYAEMMIIVNFIIALALVFGIVNSMLMAVYERIQEIGVLMAIGMKNFKIFGMIVVEAFIVGVIGTVLGIVFGYVLYAAFLKGGIDFSSFTESLSSWGIGAILYPQLSIENLIQVITIIPFVSVVGAMYPAMRAIKLQPVTAIRHV